MNGFLGLLIGCAISVSARADFGIKMIYGDDDRVESGDEVPSMQSLAASTVAMVYKSDLLKTQAGNYTYTSESFGKKMNLCEGERFQEQPSFSHCSGFLVGEDLVATAGHCVDQYDCNTKSLVFNYKMKDKIHVVTEFSPDEVYHCKQVVKREKVAAGQDYAVIKLDRKVVGFTPLKLKRSNAELKKNDKVFVIGYPMGLPLKIAKNAVVREWASNKSFFNASLDTYGGNSGSAVFNQSTMEVEGILVRGDTDLIEGENNCQVSNRCDDEFGCRGEDVTNISFVAKAVPLKKPILRRSIASVLK